MKIVIGGMVGVGKSTVAKLLAERLSYTLVEEYGQTEPEKSQFETLLDWQYKKTPFGSMIFQFYTLMQSANRQLATEGNYVMDRDLYEHMIFARRTLNHTNEQAFYDIMWEIYNDILEEPDFYVILDMTKETMVERLFNRSRKEEMNQETIDYLVRLHQTYTAELIQILRNRNIRFLVVKTDKATPEQVVSLIGEKIFNFL